MALGDKYGSVAELKGRLGVTDSAEDTRLGEALDVASRSIESVCGRQFNSAGAATARLYYPDAPTWAWVEDFHTTVGLLIATDEGDDGTYETTWAAADYQLEPLNGIVAGQTGWPYDTVTAVGSRWLPCHSRRASLQVTANWGWAAVPAPVKEACLLLAEDIHKLPSTPFGVGGFAEFGRIRARENPHVLTRIAPYIREPVLVG